MMPTLRVVAPAMALALGVAGIAACGADGGTDLQLSPAGEQGRQLARELACASCHGADGEGGRVGPPFQGLFGSTVELDDGSTVVADEAYIVESIVDPQAKQVDGYAMNMPARELSDEQVAALVDYIVELGDVAEPAGDQASAAERKPVDEDRELAGYVREPKPQVGDVALPDGTDGFTPFPLKAEPGGLLVTYFGYMNCPDYCPTTMSDVKLALSRIDRPERVQVAMVTVDPDRDFIVDPERCDKGVVLACYVTSFVDGAHALGTDDPALLERAAAPLGVNYDVTDTGDAIQVSHTTSLYAIDDEGQLVLTWQFGVAIDDLAADIEQLLAEA